jgi:putative transposase
VQADVCSLRGAKVYRALHRALCSGNLRDGFRLIEYAVQQNHFHLVIEAINQRALARGVQGLCIRLARAANRVMRRGGRVFSDRYRSRLLRDPLDARNTLRYVLNNARRHVRSARRNQTLWTDPCSSAPWFRHWSIPRGTPRFAADQRHRATIALGNAAVPARTALMAHGWKRAGPIELLHVPGPVDDSRPRSASRSAAAGGR